MVTGIQLACLDTMGVDQHSIREALEERYLKLQMAVAAGRTTVVIKNRYLKTLCYNKLLQILLYSRFLPQDLASSLLGGSPEAHTQEIEVENAEGMLEGSYYMPFASELPSSLAD